MKRITLANKKYMIIAVSVLIAEFTARNNGGVARQESNPQSATTYISERWAQAWETQSPKKLLYLGKKCN